MRVCVCCTCDPRSWLQGRELPLGTGSEVLPGSLGLQAKPCCGEHLAGTCPHTSMTVTWQQHDRDSWGSAQHCHLACPPTAGARGSRGGPRDGLVSPLPCAQGTSCNSRGAVSRVPIKTQCRPLRPPHECPTGRSSRLSARPEHKETLRCPRPGPHPARAP